MISWGHLSAAPIGIGAVTVFAGANGSGKSSALDALKAVLGARRFGQRRTPHGYLHRGPSGESDSAWVLAVASGLAELTGGADTATMVLEVTRRRRRFMLVPEALYLGLGERSLADDIAELRAAPRERWRRPEQWEREVLGPLGIGPSLIRLLELPQGEAHRIVQARAGELVPQLLGLLGHDELLERLRSERERLRSASERRDEARRSVLAERRRLAPLAALADRAEEARARAAEAAEAATSLAGALGAEIADLESHLADDDRRLADARRAVAEAEEHRRRARAAAAVAPSAPPERLQGLARELAAGTDALILGEVIDPKAADVTLLATLLGRRAFSLITTSPDTFADLLARAQGLGSPVPLALVAPEPARAADPSSPRARARARDPRADAYLELIGLDQRAESGRGGVLRGYEWLPDDPGAPAALPLAPVAPEVPADALEQLERASEALSGARHALNGVEGEQGARRRRLERLRALARPLGECEPRPLERPIEELIAEAEASRRALERLGDLERLEAAATEYAAAAARLVEVEQILGEHDETVARLSQALLEAESLWRGEVEKIMGALAARFSQLCTAAGMEGDLRFSPGAGERVDVDLVVAEYPGAPRRSFYRDGDLSGGWRAKVSLLLLMSALSGDGEGGIVLLDEHSAQLDEDRSRELGDLFRLLADEHAMQFLLCQPTTRSGEEVVWCDQQVGFLSPRDGEEWAPAPILISAAADA